MVLIQVRSSETVVVEGGLSFSIATLCQATGASDDMVRSLVGEGLLQPTGSQPLEWCFDGAALRQTRRAVRLARDLELNLAGLALVMDLLNEIEDLRARLQRG